MKGKSFTVKCFATGKGYVAIYNDDVQSTFLGWNIQKIPVKSEQLGWSAERERRPGRLTGTYRYAYTNEGREGEWDRRGEEHLSSKKGGV